jgi:hypothetical protein
MANKKEIIRDEYIRIKMSKEEKALWTEYAENIGINSTRLARNTIMTEAESFFNKNVKSNILKAYIKYAEITKNTEILERIKKD